MSAMTIATERLPRLLMAAGQPQATHHALTAELRAVLHVDGGSGGPPIAIGGGASQGLVVRPRPVTTLTLVEAPWYAVGLALIRTGAVLWKKTKNPWGLVMIVIGVHDFLDEFAEESRRRAAAVATARDAAGAASAPVERPSLLMEPPRTSPPRSPSSARTAPAQQTMGALGGGGGGAAGGLASTPHDALNPVTGSGKTGERTIRSPPVLVAADRRELPDAPRDPQAEPGLFLLTPWTRPSSSGRPCSAPYAPNMQGAGPEGRAESLHVGRLQEARRGGRRLWPVRSSNFSNSLQRFAPSLTEASLRRAGPSRSLTHATPVLAPPACLRSRFARATSFSDASAAGWSP
jgi:hypothetical protein